MARESHHPRRDSTSDDDATPIRGAAPFEPTTASASSRRSILLRTPGSTTIHPRPPGLSASGRKPAPGPSATPHARAAFRTIDSRRAAISTPHRAGRRRSGVREARETPRDTLLSLGRALAPTTKPIETSSSSPKSEDATPGGAEDDDDDDDEELPRPPRLSLPIDNDDVEDDDDDELRPHQSAGLEDENFTMRSIELGRRAYNERPGSRLSMGSMRMSEYFGEGGEGSDEGGIDPSPVRPGAANDDTGYDIPDYERSEFDVTRRELLARESDFGFEVPLDMANDTTVMAPELQESPVRQPPELFEPMLDPQSDDGGGEDFGNDYGDDYGDDDGGQDGDGLEDIPEAESGAEEARVDETGVDESGVDGTAVAKSATNRTTAQKRTIKMSRHGIVYPSLPPAVVKRLAQTFAKTSGAKGKITPDALKAVMQASEWFFQQTSETLESYANHAHRKTIDESDMLTLLKKQRQVSSHVTPFALAQRHLPRELLQELRMAPPVPPKKRRKTAHDAQDEEVT
ncbi:centromere protein T [Podospora conica]|nr:centromere protein T [Schizothecium conicum]